MFTSMYATVDGANFCDGPRMCLRKVKKAVLQHVN